MCYPDQNQTEAKKSRSNIAKLVNITSNPLKNSQLHSVSSSLLQSEVTSVTGHLLDAGEGRAGDFVAAEGLVDADEDTGLSSISVL